MTTEANADTAKPATAGGRLFSLDLLRGLDMIYLTALVPLLRACDGVWGVPAGVLQFAATHPWEGFTLYDLIMPLFIFMCGAAIPFALERRLAKNGGRPDAAYWRHVFGRFALLWFLGLLVQGRLLSFDPNKIRLYDNTLETIACGYLACAVTVALAKRTWVRIAVPVACFAVYGLLLHLLGDYSINGNFAAVVEQHILMKIVPATSETMREIATCGILADPSKISAAVCARGSEIHYTWYLTSLMFVFMTFAGYFATRILLAPVAPWTRAKRLFLYGAALLALGWGLAFCGVRVVKHVFTVSFTAQAMGWSVLLLAALYVLTDIWRLRRGLGLVILYGQFALTAYLLHEFFNTAAEALAARLTGGLPHLLGTAAYQPLVFTLVVVAECIGVLYVRRKLKARVAVA